MDGTPAKRRRWIPRYSLRTLFVLVTICGIGLGWVAYHLNWIRERHQFLSRYGYNDPQQHVPVYYELQDVPWSLRILGEAPCRGVSSPESQAKHARDLFPEGGVVSYPDP